LTLQRAYHHQDAALTGRQYMIFFFTTRYFIHASVCCAVAGADLL